jgi:hypothetical protein
LRDNVDLWRRDLHRRNIQMVILCALCSMALLVSPLVPYTFDLNTFDGTALFAAGFFAIAVPLCWIGLTLNRLAAYHRQITATGVRAALRRAWRR